MADWYKSLHFKGSPLNRGKLIFGSFTLAPLIGVWPHLRHQSLACHLVGELALVQLERGQKIRRDIVENIERTKRYEVCKLFNICSNYTSIQFRAYCRSSNMRYLRIQ